MLSSLSWSMSTNILYLKSLFIPSSIKRILIIRHFKLKKRKFYKLPPIHFCQLSLQHFFIRIRFNFRPKVFLTYLNFLCRFFSSSRSIFNFFFFSDLTMSLRVGCQEQQEWNIQIEFEDILLWGFRITWPGFIYGGEARAQFQIWRIQFPAKTVQSIPQLSSICYIVQSWASIILSASLRQRVDRWNNYRSFGSAPPSLQPLYSNCRTGEGAAMLAHSPLL